VRAGDHTRLLSPADCPGQILNPAHRGVHQCQTTDVQNTACLPGNTKVARLEGSELVIHVVYSVIQLICDEY
jgi:hypothetical protein